MGLFDKMFGGEKDKKEEKVLPWIFLTSESQLEEIAKKSFDKLRTAKKGKITISSRRCSFFS